MGYLTPNQILLQVQRFKEDKERGTIRRKMYLKNANDYLYNNHAFRLAIDSDCKTSVVIENGVKRYITNDNFIGAEVIMSGREAKDRNSVLEKKFLEKLKVNPNAKLLRWVSVERYVD